MSSKSSLFLTKDNEHCYRECNEPLYDGKGYKPENFIGNNIYIEMDKRNAEIVVDDETDIIICIKPGTELHKMVLRMEDDYYCPTCKKALNRSK